MSSTNKFPSGLNNWVDSDKPVRTDFVSDNEILDQNALWKNDYDANDIVAQSGGIDSYAMAKNTYDPVGAVAAAGGITGAIQSAVLANEGYSTYTHSKAGTVHSLTNSQGGSVIRFTAIADFIDGDTITVNGTACIAKTTDGNILEGGFFTVGSVVSCFLDGTTLNFKRGGASLNFKILVVASDLLLPARENENTIAIISDVPMPASGMRYYIAPFKPNVTEGNSVGTLWIQVGAVGTNSFDAIRDSNKAFWISTEKVYQWTGTEWLSRQGYLYQNGIWKTFLPQVDIFVGGGIVNGVGTMTKAFSTGLASTFTIGSTTLTQSAATNKGSAAGSVGYYGSKPIDLTGYTKLTVVTSSVQGLVENLYIGFLTDITSEDTIDNTKSFSSWAARLSFSSSGTRNLDVSALSGLYYFAIYSRSTSGNGATATQHNTSIILS